MVYCCGYVNINMLYMGKWCFITIRVFKKATIWEIFNLNHKQKQSLTRTISVKYNISFN